jgi:hypothetical protein
MLKQYKLVSIIYGGSGAKYAQEMNDLILSRSENERYPITSKIVMESVLTGDLLTNITEMFAKTEYCLSFLTADDCCLKDSRKVYRLRQNVVFELGMAIYRLGRERCILLSDFDPSDPEFELPSDLKGIDIKCFSPENRERVFEDVLDKILKLSSKQNNGMIPQYDKLLEREEHYVDYGDLFSSCSNLDTKEDAYLKSVLNFWETECSSFEHFEERCLYFLERIGFVSMFGRHEWVNTFLEQIKALTASYRQQDVIYCGKKQISFIHNLTRVAREYAQAKIKNDSLDSFEYEALLNTLMLDTAEESGVKNPLALTVYYDYLGLLHLHLYEISQEVEHLKEATRCFSLVMEDYADYTDLGLKIWSGFVGYNLARCHVLQYKLWSEEEDAKNALRYFSIASVIRKNWLKQSGFSQVIRSALSYEYFICRIDEINAHSFLEQKNPEDIVREYSFLERELENYLLKSEQLERLAFVQNLLTERQKEVSVDGPLAENLL